MQDDDIRCPRLDRKFDMITCVSVLEHIPQYDSAIASMAALLAPGGRLVFTFPYNETEYCENVYTLPGSNASGETQHTARAFSRKELNRWTSENGLTVVNQEYWRFFTGRFWTQGEWVCPPLPVGQEAQHQISCVVFERRP